MKTFALLSAAVATFALSGSAYAQSNSLFGSSGQSALGRTGSTGSRTSSIGGSSIGQGGSFGQSSIGQGGSFGQSSIGQGGSFGQAGGGLGQTRGAYGQTGGQLGGSQGGFVGRNSNAGRFVGQQQAGQQNVRMNRSFQGVQNTAQNANSRSTGPDPFGAQTGGGRNGSTATIRPVTRVAFRYNRRTSARIDTSVRTRFQRLAVRQPRFKGVNAALGTNGEVVLTGIVASQEAKELAGNLARLEPGVRNVTNRLLVR